MKQVRVFLVAAAALVLMSTVAPAGELKDDLEVLNVKAGPSGEDAITRAHGGVRTPEGPGESADLVGGASGLDSGDLEGILRALDGAGKGGHVVGAKLAALRELSEKLEALRAKRAKLAAGEPEAIELDQKIMEGETDLAALPGAALARALERYRALVERKAGLSSAEAAREGLDQKIADAMANVRRLAVDAEVADLLIRAVPPSVGTARASSTPPSTATGTASPEGLWRFEKLGLVVCIRRAEATSGYEGVVAIVPSRWRHTRPGQFLFRAVRAVPGRPSEFGCRFTYRRPTPQHEVTAQGVLVLRGDEMDVVYKPRKILSREPFTLGPEDEGEARALRGWKRISRTCVVRYEGGLDPEELAKWRADRLKPRLHQKNRAVRQAVKPEVVRMEIDWATDEVEVEEFTLHMHLTYVEDGPKPSSWAGKAVRAIGPLTLTLQRGGRGTKHGEQVVALARNLPERRVFRIKDRRGAREERSEPGRTCTVMVATFPGNIIRLAPLSGGQPRLTLLFRPCGDDG